MERHHRRSDVLLGGVTAVVLVLLVFGLDLNPALAISLAVATSTGVLLLRPRHNPRRAKDVEEEARLRLAHQTARANAAAIRALGERIANPTVRHQVIRIADQADRILAVMRTDQTLAAAPMFNDRVLVPARSLLAAYVHLLSRRVRSAEALLETTETHDLPMIEHAIGAFYESLHRRSVVDLATLHDVLELNLENIAAPMPRRSPP